MIIMPTEYHSGWCWGKTVNEILRDCHMRHGISIREYEALYIIGYPRGSGAKPVVIWRKGELKRNFGRVMSCKVTFLAKSVGQMSLDLEV
jgi:hypothetical protein